MFIRLEWCLVKLKAKIMRHCEECATWQSQRMTPLLVDYRVASSVTAALLYHLRPCRRPRNDSASSLK